jgi:hypothetical protein
MTVGRLAPRAAKARARVGVALPVGCSGPRPGHPVVVPAPVPTNSARLQLPPAACQLSNAQESDADYLDFLLAKSCMPRLGFAAQLVLTDRPAPRGPGAHRVRQPWDAAYVAVEDPYVRIRARQGVGPPEVTGVPSNVGLPPASSQAGAPRCQAKATFTRLAPVHVCKGRRMRPRGSQSNFDHTLAGKPREG